jgi:hypothetical protein
VKGKTWQYGRLFCRPNGADLKRSGDVEKQADELRWVYDFIPVVAQKENDSDAQPRWKSGCEFT